MIEDLLGPVRDRADPFMDDIIIRSAPEDISEDELIKAGEKDLRRVLDVLDRHQMVCKLTKASVSVEEVVFPGHVVGHGQRRPMPGNLAALNHWERPTTISELRSFMGFCNYYSGYLRMYAELSGTLHKVLQVGMFQGAQREQEKAGLDKGVGRSIGDAQENSPRKVGIVPYQSGQRICAPHCCIGLCRGSSPGAGPTGWFPCPSGLSE